jgi:hypothetical protein
MLSKLIILLLFAIVFMSSIELSQAALADNILDGDMIGSLNDKTYDQRRTNDLNKLRHFLLTSNAEQRAAKRDKGNFYRRKLVRKSNFY